MLTSLRVTTFLSAVLFAATSFSAQSPLEEANRLDAQVFRFYQNGQYTKAIPRNINFLSFVAS